MEEDIMTPESIKTIEKFPADPSAQIVYYVYEKNMIEATESLIEEIHGREYMDKYVTVASIGEDMPVSLKTSYFEANSINIYFDPLVFKYKNSWNN